MVQKHLRWVREQKSTEISKEKTRTNEQTTPSVTIGKLRKIESSTITSTNNNTTIKIKWNEEEKKFNRIANTVCVREWVCVLSLSNNRERIQ